MSKKVKLVIFLGFLTLFFGGAAFMYFKFIHNKPRIKVIAPKTDVDPYLFDSLLHEQNKDKHLD
ncbi:MAG: hypothetical protein R2852_06780 [Bacteroidia bacterium]